MKFLNPVNTPALSLTTFEVVNGASDGTAPALQSISLSTSQLNIGSGQTSLVVTVHLSDDISGVVDGGATDPLSQSERCSMCRGSSIFSTRCRVINWMEPSRRQYSCLPTLKREIGLSNGSKLLTERGT